MALLLSARFDALTDERMISTRRRIVSYVKRARSTTRLKCVSHVTARPLKTETFRQQGIPISYCLQGSS